MTTPSHRPWRSKIPPADDCPLCRGAGEVLAARIVPPTRRSDATVSAGRVSVPCPRCAKKPGGAG